MFLHVHDLPRCSHSADTEQSYAWWRRHPVDAGLKSGMLFNDKKEVAKGFVLLHAYYL